MFLVNLSAEPSICLKIPSIILAVVDLPEPLGPIKVTIFPR